MFAPYEPRESGRPRPPAPDGVFVRIATPEDAGPIALLLAEREGGNVETHREKITSEFGRSDMGEKRLLLVGEVGGRVVGYGRVVYLVPAVDAPANAAPEAWYLGGVIVAAAYRRRGIGRELIRRRLEWLRARGVGAAWYFVNAD